MTTRLHDLLAAAVEARLVVSPAVRARIDAVLDAAEAEGLDEAGVVERVREFAKADPEIRMVCTLRSTTTSFIEQALDLGATYSAERDAWTLPVGMTFDGLVAAVVARMRQ
jgi:hypothetical protein